MPQGDRVVSAIAKYLEAVEKATDFRHGDSLERFLIAEADMHGVTRAAMDAAAEVRELVELCRKIGHASTCMLTAGSVDSVRGILSPDPPKRKCTCGLDRIRELVR